MSGVGDAGRLDRDVCKYHATMMTMCVEAGVAICTVYVQVGVAMTTMCVQVDVAINIVCAQEDHDDEVMLNVLRCQLTY